MHNIATSSVILNDQNKNNKYFNDFVIYILAPCVDLNAACDAFDICNVDFHTAKRLCKKYCNLCDVGKFEVILIRLQQRHYCHQQYWRQLTYWQNLKRRPMPEKIAGKLVTLNFASLPSVQNDVVRYGVT